MHRFLIFLAPAFLLPAMLIGVAKSDNKKVESILDLAYGSDERQKLDIYRPTCAIGKRPLVLWVHGGGWVEGDKRAEPQGISVLAEALVEHGFVAAACNYRYATNHKHPAQVDDVQRAVRWLRAHAKEYGIDPDRIGAAGLSAGGHLVAVLGVRDTRAPQKDDLDKFSSKVQAVVALNGPMDLRPRGKTFTLAIPAATRNLLGKEPKEARELCADASPVTFVAKDAAPMLFVVGSKDNLVPIAHSLQMAEALKKAGAEAQVVTLEGAGHALFPKITSKAREELLEFFVKKLKP